MGKYTKAFTYLFKEKNWGWKLLIPLVGQLIVTAVSFLVSAPSAVNNNVTYKSSIYASNFAGVWAIGTCILYAVIFVIALIDMFYTYENSQAAIEKRETKGIWQYKFDVLLKRVGKLYLVNLVYGLLPALFIGCFVVAMVLFLVPTSTSISMVNPVQYGSRINTSGITGLYIVLLCFGVAVLMVLAFIWQYFVTLPAQLRLFETNTFGEAFKFSRNFKIAKENANEILKLFLLNLLIVFVAILVFIPFIVVASLALVIPVVGWLFFALIMGLFGSVAVYYQQFVLPYMTGTLWREIKK